MQSGINVKYYVRIKKSANFGIVISGLEIIEPGLCRVWTAKLDYSYMIHTP